MHFSPVQEFALSSSASCLYEVMASLYVLFQYGTAIYDSFFNRFFFLVVSLLRVLNLAFRS